MDLKTFLTTLAVIAGIALILAVFVLWGAMRRLKKIRIPEGADFFTTVRAVPLSLVVGLDLLDLALDSFASPVIWFLLRRHNLHALRNVATIEALIPISGPIPTLTIAWIAARVLNLGDRIDPDLLETRRVGEGRYEVRPPAGGRSGAAEDRAPRSDRNARSLRPSGSGRR